MFVYEFICKYRVAAATEQLKDTVQKLMTGSTDLNILVGIIHKVHILLSWLQNNIYSRVRDLPRFVGNVFQATEALQSADREHNSDFERLWWCTIPLPKKKPLVRTTPYYTLAPF